MNELCLLEEDQGDNRVDGSKPAASNSIPPASAASAGFNRDGDFPTLEASKRSGAGVIIVITYSSTSNRSLQRRKAPG